MKKKCTARSAFVRARLLLVLLVCGTMAVSILSGTLLAFFHADRANVPARTLMFAQRVAYQRAIEEVYWRHRIWPKERSDPKPSLDAVMSRAQLETKVADYLRNSRALEDYWHRPITAEQLQAETDRMAKYTKQPDVLRELFQALGNDPFLIAECLARPILSERLFEAMASNNATSAVSQAINRRETVRASFSSYTLPAIAGPSGGCTDDTWTPTSLTDVPDGRYYYTTVWTGSEMIVWGGYDRTSYFNTGGRYNPSTDSWTATNTAGAPDVRYIHTAVWTGTEMIIWGGTTGFPNFFNTGGRYNPSTDSWTATSSTNAPTARAVHTAVWTGGEMIVWGGYDNGIFLNTGGRYNPSTDSWTATSTTNAPSARYLHTAVWTGGEMIVWGGSPDGGSSYLNTGGRYNPSSDSWTATTTTNAPDGRAYHTAVLTGSQMIVWGGWIGSSDVNTGGRYNPSTDSWAATSTTNAPDARYSHAAVWTGSEMIVWGGWTLSSSGLNTGGRYNSNTDSWTATGTTNAPAGRFDHTAIWTGSEMIVWGGRYYSGGYHVLNTGGRYCAQSGAPSPTPTATPCASIGAWTEQASYPIATSGHAVVSVGGNVYSFGGIVNNAAITNAYKYSPATNTWTPITPLPAPRGWFSAASDGTFIYLLGGVDQNFNTTATLWRYDPVSNTYNTSFPPYTIPTYFHASVYLNGKIYRIAGRAIGTDFHVEVYDIATNTWSMAANYPFANHSLMAAALGSFIYAGGGNASPDKTWRYDPSTNTWDDAAIADLPAGRSAAASGAYNGRWLLAGGDVNFATSNSVIAWDPATNTWNNLPNMVQARDNLEGATAGQSFYAVAGTSGPGNPTNDNQQYTEIPCGTPSPTPTATPTATLTPPPTPTVTATFTPTPTPTGSPTPTPSEPPFTPTATPTATATPTSTPRATPTPRIAPTPRSRPTPVPRPYL
jgi:N-acetylneuraminic acid mutarotase